jgi:cell division protein FtsB
MNQKLQQLNEENAKLRKNIDNLEKKGVIIEE